MPSPKEGTWTEYALPQFSDPVVVRLFTSEVAALRSAIQHGNQVTHLPFGTTLEEYLRETGDSITTAIDWSDPLEKFPHVAAAAAVETETPEEPPELKRVRVAKGKTT